MESREESLWAPSSDVVETRSEDEGDELEPDVEEERAIGVFSSGVDPGPLPSVDAEPTDLVLASWEVIERSLGKENESEDEDDEEEVEGRWAERSEEVEEKEEEKTLGCLPSCDL